MAFQQPANNVRYFNSAANQGGNQNWRADAFVNIYLPRRDGSRAKLGSISLKASRATDAQVIEHLQNAPDLATALEQLKGRLEIDFNMADGSDSAALDLG